jgi:hypothetical protein
MLMKNIFTALLLICVLFGCDEDGTRLQLKENIAPNQLQDLSASDYVLQEQNAGQTFETFQWSVTDYGFPAAPTYTLEIDKAGNNFASPVELLSSDTLSASVSVSEMNDKLLDLGLLPDQASNVEIRVRSDVNENIEPVYSDAKSFSVTPYAMGPAPIFMIGAATGGWDLAKAVPLTNVSQDVYETVAEFTSGETFRFFTTPSWEADQYNWGSFAGGSVDSNLEPANDNDNNFRFTGDSGWYKITTDVKNRTITMEPSDKP